MENRDQTDRSGRASSAQSAKAILAPTRQDGVGNALRAAYDMNASGLPEDMQKLLARLS